MLCGGCWLLVTKGTKHWAKLALVSKEDFLTHCSVLSRLTVLFNVLKRKTHDDLCSNLTVYYCMMVVG